MLGLTFIGTCSPNPSILSSGKVAGMSGVQMGPGATALTRMRFSWSWRRWRWVVVIVPCGAVIALDSSFYTRCITYGGPAHLQGEGARERDDGALGGAVVE